MPLQFDAKQAYQVDAVSTVVDLFEGHETSERVRVTGKGDIVWKSARSSYR